MTDKQNLPEEQLEQQEPENESQHSKQAVPEQKAPATAESQAAQEQTPSIFDKPFHEEKAPKKRKMSRQAKYITLSIVLCIALVGGIFAINRFLPEPEEETTSSTPGTFVYDYSEFVSYSEETQTKGIQQVTVKNEVADYVIGYTIGEDVQTDQETGAETVQTVIKWNIQGQEDADYDYKLIANFISSVVRVPYINIYTDNGSAPSPDLEGQTYLQECGFDDPTAEMTVTFHDGNSYTARVGNKTPNNEGYFFTYSGDSKIYVVAESAVVQFIQPLVSFVSTEIIPVMEPESDEDDYFENNVLAKYDSITVSGTNFSRPIVFDMRDSSAIGATSVYGIQSPVNRYAHDTEIANLLSPLSNGLQSTECLTIHATAEDYHRYGLDQPVCKVTYVVKGEETVLNIGTEVADDYYAVSVDGKDIIYKVASSALTFMNMQVEEYYDTLLYLTDIKLVNSITARVLQSDGTVKTTKFTLHHGTQVSESGTTQTTLWIESSEGGQCIVEDFREFYQRIIGLTAQERVSDGKEAATPTLSFTIDYVSDPRVDVIKLSPYSDRRYYYTLNGTGDAIVLSSSVNELISNIDDLVADAKTAESE